MIADRTAVTLPGFGILIHPNIQGTSKTKVLQHEYGHYLDYKYAIGSASTAPTSTPAEFNFYVIIGIPSLFNAATGLGGDHSSYWTEIRANKWATEGSPKNVSD